MRQPSIALALLLAAALVPAAPALAAKKKAAEKPEAGATASPETIKLVEMFTTRETADLPPEAVPEFMAVDVKTLPARLKTKYTAKKIELITLKKDADSKKKGYYRRMGNDKTASCDPQEGDEQAVGMLKGMGFEQITDDEEHFLMKKTNCSECEMNEEFSLTIYIVPPKKKGERPVRYLFLNQTDPLMALLAQYRSGGTAQGTNFFGVGGAGGCR